MSPEKKKGDLDRNYSEETFYTDSSEDVRSKCKSAVTLLQRKRQLRPINGSSNPYRSTTRLTLTSSKNNVSLVSQKIMSAKLLRVKQLQNELTEAQFQLNELLTENRILRTLQKRQDTALKKYEGTHAELPQLIRSHNEEMRTLKTKLKQVKSQCRELENNLKIRESELAALQEQHKHLITLSKSKHLGEREQLQQQLEQMQDVLKEQDKKVQMLTRKLMLESKNYKHQLTAEVARQKRTSRELDVAMERIAQLETLLVAKEKYIALNLTRSHANIPTTTISLGLPSRFQLLPTQAQSAAARLPSQRHYSSERLSINPKENEEISIHRTEGSDILTQRDMKSNKEHTDSNQSQSFSEHKKYTRSHVKDEEEEDEEDDTDEDYQQYMLSESTESHSYSSQITASKSTENILSKDFKDASKEKEIKFNSSSNLRNSELNMQMPYIPEINETKIKSSKKRTPLRRYSVSGDSEFIVNDQISRSRRGSVSGAGDSGTTSSDKSIICKPSSNKNLEDPTNVSDSTEHIKQNDISENNSEGRNVIESALEIPQIDETAEEYQVHSKTNNYTWDEIENGIRDQTIRAQSAIEKYNEVHRYVDKQISKKSELSESYDKNHLLAALRAIEGGADPVDINDSEDREIHQPVSKPKKVEYGNASFTVENFQRGISAHASSSVSAIDKTRKESSSFWEKDTIMTPNLIRSEMDMSKSKSEVLREIFGHHK